MKVWSRIFLSIFVIFLSLTLFSLVKNLTISSTGQFLLITGSGIGLIAGGGLFLSALIPIIKQFGKGAVKKERKDTTGHFFEEFVRELDNLYKKRTVTDEDVYSIREKAREAMEHGVKPARWFVYASPKSVRYMVEYLSKENHVQAARRMIESGYSPYQVGKLLLSHVVEHHQIKDTRDFYLAKKYFK